MSEFLGQVYRSGDPAPEAGTYQLQGENTSPDSRTIIGRVFRFKRGEVLPGHPDTGGPAEWRFVRIDQYARTPAPITNLPPAPS